MRPIDDETRDRKQKILKWTTSCNRRPDLQRKASSARDRKRRSAKNSTRLCLFVRTDDDNDDDDDDIGSTKLLSKYRLVATELPEAATMYNVGEGYRRLRFVS